jgi:hypothetical protein
MNETTTLNTRYISTSGNFLIDCKDDIINVDSTSGAVVLILPNITANGLNSIPKSFFINDIGNLSATNNISIIPTPSDSVNSTISFVISNNGGSVICTPSSANEWFINSAVPSGMISAFNNGWIDYTDSSTIVGWASVPAPTKKILYKIIDNNKTMLVYFSISGTSNSATTTFTLPITPLSGIASQLIYHCHDNNVPLVGLLGFSSLSNVVTLRKDVSGGNFTAIGIKIVGSILTIPI